jgi:hypothetical protein
MRNASIEIMTEIRKNRVDGFNDAVMVLVGMGGQILFGIGAAQQFDGMPRYVQWNKYRGQNLSNADERL